LSYLVESKVSGAKPIATATKHGLSRLCLFNVHAAGRVSPTDERVHRLEMATFLRTLSHDGVFGLACCGWGSSPTPFHSIYPLHSSYVAPSTPSPARLARYSNLYSNQSPPLPLYLVSPDTTCITDKSGLSWPVQEPL
jgi:hypothetical protein